MRRLLIRGIEFATVDEGRGAVVLLVHGFPLDHRMWQGQIDVLARRYRVIAPDLGGFGQSGVCSDAAATMSEYADDLASLLDELGIAEPAVLVGLSMGGYVGLEFWRRHPSRLRALALCDTRASADTAEAAAGRMATADRVLQEGPGFLAETMIPRLFATAGQAVEPPWIEATRGVILAGDPRGIAAASRGMAQRFDFTPLLGQIRIPVLAMVGTKDVLTPSDEMRKMADAVARARFVEISGAGHMATLENPAESNAALLAFLADVMESGPATGS